MKIALRLYCKNIRLEGLEGVPRDKPLLVTPNHQNAFLDPFLVGAFLPVRLHILTRADIFNRWTKPFLGLLNMMPIYRIRDGYAKLSQNDAVFETCRDLFRSDKSILIFAEGNHGEHHYLRPLTKGAARIALLSQQEMSNELYVLPVGVNYFDHQKSRSSVVIKFGEPVAVKAFEKQYTKEGAKGLLAMKEAISNGMKSTLVIPEKTDDYEQRKEAIFQQQHVGMSFDQLRAVSKDVMVKKAKRKGLIARVLNPIPFLLIYKVVSGLQDKVFISSMKFAIGLFALPIWWIIVFAALTLSVSVQVACLAVFVMIFGLFFSYS